MRYYYKDLKGNPAYSLKSPLEDTTGYIQITETEWNKLIKKLEPKPLTQEQKDAIAKRKRIAELKKFLADTDYTIIKIAEGVATAEEYSEVITRRQEARAELNELM